MYCLFTLPYRMTTYYSYKVTNNGEQEVGVEYMKLWENYDDMCDELDKWVGGLTGKDVKPDRSKIPCLYPCASMVYHKEDGCEAHITRMQVVPKKKTYEELDCSEQDAHLETHFDEIFKRSKKVETLNGTREHNMWYDPLTRWVYNAYFPEDEEPQTFYSPESERIKTIEFVEPKKYVYHYFRFNSYHGIQKSSQKYSSFDEACDALEKELRELHGEGWEPRMPREEFRKYMGDYPASTYDFYKTDTYVLNRTEV